jgi:hypothetical protein
MGRMFQLGQWRHRLHPAFTPYPRNQYSPLLHHSPNHPLKAALSHYLLQLKPLWDGGFFVAVVPKELLFFSHRERLKNDS